MKVISLISLALLAVAVAGCMNVLRFDGESASVKNQDNAPAVISKEPLYHRFQGDQPADARWRDFGYVNSTYGELPEMIELHDTLPADEVRDDIFAEGEGEKPKNFFQRIASMLWNAPGRVLEAFKLYSVTSVKYYVRVFEGDFHQHEFEKEGHKPHSSLTFPETKSRHYFANLRGHVMAADFLEKFLNKKLIDGISLAGATSKGELADLNGDGKSDIVVTKFVDANIRLDKLLGVTEDPRQAAEGENIVSSFIKGNLDQGWKKGLVAASNMISPVGFIFSAAVFQEDKENPKNSNFRTVNWPKVRMQFDDFGKFQPHAIFQNIADVPKLENLAQDLKDGKITEEQFKKKQDEILGRVLKAGWADFNADQKDDLVLAKKEGARIEVYIWLNTTKERGSRNISFKAVPIKWVSEEMLNLSLLATITASEIRFPDINGDGAADIVTVDEFKLPIVGGFNHMDDIGIKIAINNFHNSDQTKWQSNGHKDMAKDNGRFTYREDLNLKITEQEVAALAIPIPFFSKEDYTGFVDVDGDGCESYTRIGNYAPSSRFNLPLFSNFSDRMMSYNKTDCAKMKELTNVTRPSYRVYKSAIPKPLKVQVQK